MRKISGYISKYLLVGLWAALWTMSAARAQVYYKHFDLETGLPSNRIYKIMQDHGGFIWIATDKGLVKFDGEHFEVFNTVRGLPSNDIWEIMITPDDRVWFFTRARKLGYIRNDSVFSFPVDKQIVYPSFIGVQGNEVTFNSSGFNYRFRNGKWIRKPVITNKSIVIPCLHPVIRKVEIPADKRILFYTGDSVIARPGFYLTGIGTSFRQLNDSLIGLYEMKNRFYLINIHRLEVHRVQDSIFRQARFARSLDFDGHIQITGDNFWAELTSDYQLTNKIVFDPRYQITNVFKDRSGNYWASTFNHGVYMFTHEGIRGRHFLTDKKINFIETDGERLYAAVLNRGVLVLDSAERKFHPFFPSDDYFFSLRKGPGDRMLIFAGKNTWLLRNNKPVTGTRAGREGRWEGDFIYTIGINGVQKYDRQLHLLATLTPQEYYSMARFGKRLILANTIMLSSLENDTVVKLFGNEVFDGFPVLSLQPRGKYLYIGTDGNGLYVWDGKHKPRHVARTAGLIVNDMDTYDGHILLATQEGILDLEMKEKGDLTYYTTYRKADGLISDQINRVVFFNGKIYASGYNGISAIKPGKSGLGSIQRIYFKRVTYSGQPVSEGGSIRYRRNGNLRVDFGLVDYYSQEHNKLYYRLWPVQKTWLPVRARQVNFNNPDPGIYSVQIKAVNPYRQQLTRMFRLEIEPRWYQTGWGRGLLLLLMLGLLVLIAWFFRRYELKKQTRRLEIRNKMTEFQLHALRSQMNPHFVFNSLNAILYYITDGNFEHSETYLIRFSRLIRKIFDLSREEEIPLSNEIDLLKSYLELEKMRFGERFDYCVDIDKRLDTTDTRIPTMLLQPIVENAVNHGIFHKDGEGTVCIRFRKISERSFTVEILDDGIGVEKSREIYRRSLRKHTSRSTQILQERIALLNMSGKWKVTYRLDDLTPDSGNAYNTRVTLKITRL